jgi:hypothetical protein
VRSYSNIIKTVIINIILIVVILIIFEVVLRNQKDQLPQQVRESVIPPGYKVSHPILGSAPKPFFAGKSFRTGREVTYNFGARGERVGSSTAAPTNALCHILAFGDSNTLGWGLRYEETWPSLLQSGLKKSVVYNFGVSGYGLDQYYLIYEEKKTMLEHQLVVVYLPHFEEIRHMKKYRFGRPKPYFKKLGGELILHTDHIKPSLVERLHGQLPGAVTQLNVSLVFFRLIESLQRWAQSTTEERTKETAEVAQLARMLLDKLGESVERQGANFLLITSIQDFCEKIDGYTCIEFNHTPEFNLIGDNGENFYHLNLSGTKKISSSLISTISTQSLLPDDCLSPKAM